ERDANSDRLAVRDPALDAARMVGSRPHAPAARVVERIVVLAAEKARAGEPAADLESLRRRQRQHRLGQIRFQLVEHRLAPSRRPPPAPRPLPRSLARRPATPARRIWPDT